MHRQSVVSLGQHPRWTPPSHDSLAGTTNQNPSGLSLIELIKEDFRTHDASLLEPGFWAVAVHRFGNWRMSVNQRALRVPLSLAYGVAHRVVSWLWGIDLEYSVRLGRRVRLWHHGAMILSARAIGDDVHLRHSTTLGVARRNEPWNKPVIGDRVDIGVGACILGNVYVGDDSVIGANAVVLESCPPGAVVVGVPGRTLHGRSPQKLMRSRTRRGR